MSDSGAAIDPFSDPEIPETAPVRAGQELAWDVIEEYLRAKLPAELTDGAFQVSQFPYGSANLTYLLAFGETELVLRRPPFGTLAPGAHDMKREFRVLSRLWEVYDAAPRAYVFCDDHAIAGADFFVMQRLRGDVVRSVIPESMRSLPDVGRRLGFTLVDTIARFHRVDPEACGLGSLGRPDGFVERQVSGWKKRWDLVADTRYDDAMTEIHARLAADIPVAPQVSLVHNDLKLDNVMFASGDPDTIVALFDWDMTTTGDPLIDLGTLLNYWPDPSDPPERVVASSSGLPLMGLPTRSEITARYGEATGFDLSRVSWYEAFAQWKTAVVIQQLHHRWLVGDSTDERMETIADRLPSLLVAATGLLDS